VKINLITNWIDQKGLWRDGCILERLLVAWGHQSVRVQYTDRQRPHPADLNIFLEYGADAVLHRGGLSDAEKQAAVDRFQNDPSVKVFIGSVRASGVGLTLTASSHIIFAEQDWTPAVIDQCESRCHRLGQQESLLVQHLVFDGSLDATMVQRQVEKQDVINQIMQAA